MAGLPESHRRLLPATNGLERLNKEVKRRTQVAGVFPNEASYLRLLWAILKQTRGEGQAGRAHLGVA